MQNLLHATSEPSSNLGCRLPACLTSDPRPPSFTVRLARRALALWILFLAASCLGRADLLLHEPFDYPDGPLTEVSAGRWTTHSGTAGQVQVAAGAVRLSDQASEDVHLPLPGGVLPAASDQVLYAAFSVRFTELPRGTGTFFAHFKDGTTGFRGRLFAAPTGAAPGCFRVGIAEAANTPTLLDRDLQLHHPYTLVCRYEVATGASQLWVDPADETDPALTAADDGSPLPIHGFALRQSVSSGNSMGGLLLDDLRLATQFASLFLEPDPAPRILHPPASLALAPGQTATFSVAAAGTPPLSYQWFHNQAPLPEATSPVLTLTHVTPLHAGTYQVQVSNEAGSVLSAIATLTLTDRPPTGSPPTLLFTNVLSQLRRPGDLPAHTFTELALRPGEHLTVHVLAHDPDSGPVTLESDLREFPASARWAFDLLDASRPVGTFTWTPSEAEAGRLFDLTLRATSPAGTGSQSWLLYVPTSAEAQIVLAEFLANPATSAEAPHFNPLHRETPAPNPSQHDEFVELVNTGPTPLSLEGWTLSDAVQTRHRFPADTTLDSRQALVVYGGPRESHPPGLPVLAVPASEGSSGLALNNTGDHLLLRNAAGHLIERVVYTTAQLHAAGSLSRYPTLDSAFVPQASAGTQPATPGLHPDGRAWHVALSVGDQHPGALNARLLPDGRLSLRWPMTHGTTFTILAAPTPTGPWHPHAIALAAGEWTDDPPAPDTARFYRLSSP